MSGKHLCRFPRLSACRRGLAIKNLIAFAVCGLFLEGFQARGGTYTQNFDSFANGTTGTALNDGSNLVGGAPVQVQSSGIYGSPATPDWKALWVTSTGQNQTGNYFLPNLNSESLPATTPVTSFQIDFTLLLNNQAPGIDGFGDGISINFGKLNNTTSVYGNEYSMYNTVGGTATGDVLSVSFVTLAATRGMRAQLNGGTLSGPTGTPVLNGENPPPATAFLPVSVFWDSNGLDVSYNGTSLFNNLSTGAFSPTVDYQFAFAARNGSSTENIFLDNISAIVVPEPSSLLLLAAAAVPAGAAALRRRRNRASAAGDGR